MSFRFKGRNSERSSQNTASAQFVSPAEKRAFSSSFSLNLRPPETRRRYPLVSVRTLLFSDACQITLDRVRERAVVPGSVDNRIPTLYIARAFAKQERHPHEQMWDIDQNLLWSQDIAAKPKVDIRRNNPSDDSIYTTNVLLSLALKDYPLLLVGKRPVRCEKHVSECCSRSARPASFRPMLLGFFS